MRLTLKRIHSKSWEIKTGPQEIVLKWADSGAMNSRLDRVQLNWWTQLDIDKLEDWGFYSEAERLKSMKKKVKPTWKVCFWDNFPSSWEMFLWKFHKRAFIGLCACVKLLQSCPTPCNPMDCSSPGSSVHGMLQARMLEWVAISSSRGIFPSQRVTSIFVGLEICSRMMN